MTADSICPPLLHCGVTWINEALYYVDIPPKYCHYNML